MGWVVFGECMFDPEARELRRSERRVVVHKNTVLNPFSADVFVGNSENTPYRITRNHVEVSNLFAIGIQWGGVGSTVARNTIVGTGPTRPGATGRGLGIRSSRVSARGLKPKRLGRGKPTEPKAS